MRMFRMLFVVLALAASAFAGPDTPRGVLIHPAVIYISPDTASNKLITAERGRECAILDKSNAWVHVICEITQPFAEPRSITGWIQEKGFVTKDTPKGDQIIYGEAVDSENEASKARGRQGAAIDARRLYYRVFDHYPQSPLAGEALYRAADIQWQLDAEDVNSRKSRRSLDSSERPQIDEENMKLVEKKFPRTKWADLATYHRLENKLCADWQAQSKCPAKEIDYFTTYAEEHPDSPRAAEALYNAAYRAAALIEIYKSENNFKKSEESGPRAITLAQRGLAAKNISQDWSARLQDLIYKVQNKIPVFGNTVE